MIWEHGLELIVMLTNLEEYSKVKCSKYWPDEVRGSRAFGAITVHHVSEKRSVNIYIHTYHSCFIEGVATSQIFLRDIHNIL
jgi:protein tyrosine phosphatase